MVWIVKYDDHGHDKHEITAWNSEDDALKHAVNAIVLHINSIRYHVEPDLHRAVSKINGYIENNNYRKIVDYWNSCDYNLDYNNPAYWEISEVLTKSYRSSVSIFDKNKFPFTDKTAPAPITSGGLVNNHTCVQCGNTRLNKREVSCWSCGTKI